MLDHFYKHQLERMVYVIDIIVDVAGFDVFFKVFCIDNWDLAKVNSRVCDENFVSNLGKHFVHYVDTQCSICI